MFSEFSDQSATEERSLNPAGSLSPPLACSQNRIQHISGLLCETRAAAGQLLPSEHVTSAHFPAYRSPKVAVFVTFDNECPTLITATMVCTRE